MLEVDTFFVVFLKKTIVSFQRGLVLDTLGFFVKKGAVLGGKIALFFVRVYVLVLVLVFVLVFVEGFVSFEGYLG